MVSTPLNHHTHMSHLLVCTIRKPLNNHYMGIIKCQMHEIVAMQIKPQVKSLCIGLKPL
jgi:hypothetical protein